MPRTRGIALMRPRSFKRLARTRLAGKWLPPWGQRKEVTVDNTGNPNNLTHYSVLADVDTASLVAAGDMQASGADIRFTDSDGETVIPHTIELGMNTAHTFIWIKVPLIPANDTVTIYMYYDNPVAVSTDNPNRAFDEYEGFEDLPLGVIGVAAYQGMVDADKDPLNPVLTVGGAEVVVAFGTVLIVGGVYYFYYTREAPAGVFRIDRATSPDGRVWTKDVANNPVLTVGAAGAWDEKAIWCPNVWRENGTWYMIYTGQDAANIERIGLATSPDGINFTKSPANPVLTGTLAWECDGGMNSSIENFGVIKVGNTYYLWYNRVGVAPRQSGLATATDLTVWVKDPANPIFPTIANLVTSAVFHHDCHYYMILSETTFLRVYRCEDPHFYIADRQQTRYLLSRTAAWEIANIETPDVLTHDIYKNTFPNDEFWFYYAGRDGPNIFQTGLVRTDWDALGMIVPWWLPAGVPTVVAAPVFTGAHSLQSVANTNLDSRNGWEFFGRKTMRVLGGWHRRPLTAGDLEMYIEEGAALRIALCMRGGTFQYWNGGYVNTGIAYAADTWYYLCAEIDCVANTFNFVVRDATWTEIVRVNTIAFPATNYIDRVIIGRCNGAFMGNAYSDGFRGRKYSAPEPTVTVA